MFADARDFTLEYVVNNSWVRPSNWIYVHTMVLVLLQLSLCRRYLPFKSTWGAGQNNGKYNQLCISRKSSPQSRVHFYIDIFIIGLLIKQSCEQRVSNRDVALVFRRVANFYHLAANKAAWKKVIRNFLHEKILFRWLQRWTISVSLCFAFFSLVFSFDKEFMNIYEKQLKTTQWYVEHFRYLTQRHAF